MSFIDLIFNEQIRVYLVIVIIIISAIIFTKFLNLIIKYYLQKGNKSFKEHETQLKLIKNSITVFISLIALGLIIYFIPSLRALSISLLAGAGILAIVIGFASQHAFSNLIGGIAIIISQPYKLGDIVRMDEGKIYGTIEDITLRHTVVKDFENNRFFVPNSIASSTIIENHTIGDPKVLKQIKVLIGYESDIDKATKIIKEIIKKHPNWIDVRTKKEKKNNAEAINVRVMGLEDSGVLLKAYAWSENPGLGFAMNCEVLKDIKERFQKENISIPYPHRTIVYKNSKSK